MSRGHIHTTNKIPRTMKKKKGEKEPLHMLHSHKKTHSHSQLEHYIYIYIWRVGYFNFAYKWGWCVCVCLCVILYYVLFAKPNMWSLSSKFSLFSTFYVLLFTLSFHFYSLSCLPSFLIDSFFLFWCDGFTNGRSKLFNLVRQIKSNFW